MNFVSHTQSTPCPKSVDDPPSVRGLYKSLHPWSNLSEYAAHSPTSGILSCAGKYGILLRANRGKRNWGFPCSLRYGGGHETLIYRDDSELSEGKSDK
jgi:hypothetical protein